MMSDNCSEICQNRSLGLHSQSLIQLERKLLIYAVILWVVKILKFFFDENKLISVKIDYFISKLDDLYIKLCINYISRLVKDRTSFQISHEKKINC